MKTIIWVLVILLLGVGGYYLFNNYLTGPATKSAYTASDFSWRIEKASNYEETLPRQIVFLDVKGRSYKAGESIGCNVESDAQEANEITRQTCWFGGGGDIYSVFQENGSYLLKHRWIQESGGPEVNAAPEGPWETLLQINR